MRISLEPGYFNNKPLAVLNREYNLIVWFRVDDAVIAIDIIYDNYPPYTLNILSIDEAKTRYEELIDEGWRPVINMQI